MPSLSLVDGEICSQKKKSDPKQKFGQSLVILIQKKFKTYNVFNRAYKSFSYMLRVIVGFGATSLQICIYCQKIRIFGVLVL
jgi:hypothetical protein